MFAHYLKIAFRNLWKYKAQNIISIVGLAVGFVCFAFSTLWLRYEMSYDNFHAKADRIYRVNMSANKWSTAEFVKSGELQDQTPYPLVNWLKSNFPEIEDACGIRIERILHLDYSFCKMFDLPLPEDFFIEGRTDKPIAVIPEQNHEETIKFITELYKWDVSIQATIPQWPANTNIQFHVAAPITLRYGDYNLNSWSSRIFDTYILIKTACLQQARKIDNGAFHL